MKNYRVNEKCILEISKEVLSKLLKYRQQNHMDESGGILLGKIMEDYSRIIITDISEPTSLDKRGRFFFIRNKKSAQQIINLKWEESKKIVNYIGEWHTHQECIPQPSNIDLRLIKKSLKENYCPFKMLFLVIVGMNGDLYVGYKTYSMKNVNKLEEIHD